MINIQPRAAALALGVALAAAPAAAQTDLKFSLDFRFQGGQAPLTHAVDKGYFSAEKLNVTIDSAQGSGDAVNRVATGAYQVGFADISAMIRFNAQNPGRELIAVMIAYDSSPLAIVTLKSKNITKPRDLEGRKLAAPELDTGRQIFPVFAKLNGLDMAKISLQNVDIRLRESLLVKGDVDALTGFVSSARFNLIATGVKDEDIVALRYPAFGVDLYSNAIITTTGFAEKNPDVVRGVIRAVIKGLNDGLKDPASTIPSIKKRDPTVNDAMEAQRLAYINEILVATPGAKANGYSAVNPDRLKRAIELVADAYGVAPPKPEAVYTDKYLPPAAERQLAK